MLTLCRALPAVALASLVAGCAGETVHGPDPAPVPVDVAAATAWVPGDHRPPTGVEGKPLRELATGTVIADELLVRFTDGLGWDEVQASVIRAGGAIVWKAPATGYHVVRFPDETAAEQALQLLSADDRVVDCIYNHVATGAGIGTSPTYELAIRQWNLYAMTLDPLGNRTTAEGVVLAVLDTGVAYEDFGPYKLAPDLAGVEFVPGYDFINDDEHANDDQRHGTHVTGVIAASSGIASVAPGVAIMPVKVLDGGNSGTELALAEGLRFAADNGAQIANMSLSFPPTYFPSRLLQAAVDHAAQRGVIMVAAAGNHGEAIVAYPAAFRDVIAVGASDLPEEWETDEDDPERQWEDTLGVLRRAPYSNHSYKLDVLAPAGTIPGDANGDGLPEAVLAQTFATGDPTAFGYYFYAGTSQAAAEISALAAVMLAQNPDLDAFTVRALLTENAKRVGLKVLSGDSGRGAVRARKTIAAARKPRATEARPRYFANVAVTLHDVAAGTVARAHVEILDQTGAPVPKAKVYGMFTGAAFGSVVGTTNAKGIVAFTSAPLAGNLIVAFQVEAVTTGKGGKLAFDRPRGFLRIDSLSLELLATFGQGIGTSPTGIGTSPTDGAAEGAGGPPGPTGIGTSPTIPLPSDPAQTPISIAYDPSLYAGTNYRPTLLLPNFSWGLATAPMAVAVDESWFLATFPGAADRRVVSYGRGYGDSAFFFDATSFPREVLLPPSDTAPQRLALVLVTYTSGIGTSPTGIGTSPTGIGTSPTGIAIDRGKLDAALASEIEILIGLWYASIGGVGTSPTYADGWTMSEAMFNHVSALATSYAEFGATELSQPSSAYGYALGAASMPMAPVAPDADGEGVGIAAMP